jgi:hypothetical protein
MLCRALSLSFLLNTLLSAGDTPQSPYTYVEMEKQKPKAAQVPLIEFKNSHIKGDGGGGGNGKSSSSVGSSTGGSALTLVKDLLAPSSKELERDREIEALNKDLSRAMTKDKRGQFVGIPQPNEYYIKDPKAVQGFAKSPQSTPKTSTPTPVQPVAAPVVVKPEIVSNVASAKTEAPRVDVVVSTPTPVPTPAPVVSTIPIVTTPVATPTPAPANSPSIITTIAGAPMLGGLQGNTPLVTPTVTGPGTGLPSFNILNNAGTKPLSPMFAPAFTPAAAPTVPNGIQPPAGYVAPSGPSALEVAGAGAATMGMWGSIKGAAVAAAAAAKGAIVAATPYVVAVVTSPYVIVPVVVGGAGYGAYKLGQYHGNQRRIAHEIQEAAAKAARESAVHRQIHETVHTPTPQPTQSHVTPHSDLPARLQPSDNPVKLGKKIYQPGPLDGQGNNPHGYKDQWGHYKYYTPENVAHAIESIEKGVWHGQNPKSGKHLYTYDCPKTGLQKWAETDNNGEIMNCGINEVRFIFCPKTNKLVAPTGFKKPKGKDVGWVDKTLKAGVISSALNSQYASSSPLFTEMIEADLLPGEHYFLPQAPRDITVHDLEAERMIKNHYVAMEQKKIEVIQNKINKGSNL